MEGEPEGGKGVFGGASKSSKFGEVAVWAAFDVFAANWDVEGLKGPEGKCSSAGGADAEARRDGGTEEAGRDGGGACCFCNLR